VAGGPPHQKNHAANLAKILSDPQFRHDVSLGGRNSEGDVSSLELDQFARQSGSCKAAAS
jgi:hypothetical protein